MALLERQRLLAQLYTDTKLRAQFIIDPETIGLKFGLTGDDITQLHKIVASDIDEFARSLQHKRLHEAGDFLPVTRRALADNFRNIFLKYTDAATAKNDKSPRNDAIEFAKYLQQDLNVALWIRELAIYETAFLQTLNKKLQIYKFHFAINKIFRLPELSIPKDQTTIAIWLRLTPQSRLRHYAFNY